MRLRSFIVPALLTAILIAAWIGHSAVVRAQTETTILGDLISRALSTPTTRVFVGAVDGALSSDATIRDVSISDRDGVWLRLDRARLIWRRTALLSRRLEIDRLEIGHLEFLRRPLPSEDAQAASNEPLWPELPVKVEVRAFSVADLTLGEPVLGAPARLGANGRARLGDPSEGLDLDFTARRLDARGQFAVQLAYVPQGARLDASVNLDEPAGGLVARLARIPGLPPVRLDMSGHGVLDDWRATLTFQAGPDIGATGEARLVRADAGRRLTLDLSANIEGLLPAPVAPVFAGTTHLQGATRFGDAGTVTIETLDLTSRTARLSIAGSLSADRILDVKAQARALPTNGRTTQAGAAEIGSLTFDATATGPLRAPRIAGQLAAESVRVPQGSFGQVRADITADPEGGTQQTTRFAVRANARATGIVLADPALRDAVGAQAEFALVGLFGSDGIGDIDTLSVTSPNADLRYQGRLGASVVAGTLQAEIRRLEALSGLAGRRLSGSFSGTAKLDGNPRTRSIRAEVDARGTGIAIAQPVIDRLTGGRLTVRGIVRTLPDGYGFENLSIEGASFSGHVDGSATQSAADVTARLELSDLEKVHPALSGRAATTARLSGSLARPDLAASLTTTDARALGRPIRDLKVDATVNDVTGPLDAGLSATGSIGGRPLRASARLRKGTDPAWTLDGLDVLVGSASIKGRATIDPADLVDGTLRIAAPDLDHLSPLVLTPLAGALDATVTLARVNGGQDAQVQAKGSAIRAFGIALDGLDIDLAASDVRRHPVIDGHVLAQSLKAGGETFTSVDLRARGTPQASDLSLVATSRGFALDGRARLYPADRTRLEVSSLSAERGRQRLSLAGPATFTFDSGSVDISGLVVAAGTGRISVSGRAGSELNLKIAARAVPLSIVDVVLPDAGLSGTLDGEAELAGSSSRPNGRYRLSLSGFAAPQTRSAGLPLIEASASGRLADGRADIDGRVRAGAGVDLAVAGAVPLEADGPLRLTIKGRADAALANTLLGATGRSVSGRIQIDAGLSGTPRVPKIDGQATLSGGTFVDALQGIRLSDVQGRFVGSGDRITIERLTATTRNGGPVSVEGTVTVNAAAGFPGSLRIRARRAELVSNDIVDAVASLDLTLEGPLAQRPRIAGRVDLVSMDVTVPDRFSATVQPLPGTRHIAPPPKIKALLAEIRKAEVERKSARPFDASLDIVLSAPNRIFVRGRGIDAELGGDLRLTGTSRDPVAIGAFELRRGRFTIIGQRLDFTRGRLDFTGDLSPELDFVAEANAGEVTARVSVTGPASRPDIALTSEPPLPQDEVLSRLLFQKASGSVSGFQALQLAQAVAQFAGTGSGPGVFEEARRALGVDSLDITSGAKGGPALGVSRYIGDRLSVGVKAGARTEDAGVTVGIDVTRRVKVQGDIGADGRTSLGVGAEWEY